MAIDTGGRPLSPHLQVYRPQLTSVLSITHRASGVFLSLGTVFLACWLLAVASGPEAYAEARGFATSWVGQLGLLAWSGALFYHLCNGIRHLFWDAGRGLEIEQVNRSGWIVLAAAALLTGGVWLLACT